MAHSALILDPLTHSTLNNTHTCIDITQSTTHSSSASLYLLLPVILCSICGNILVIIAVTIERKLQNMINYFLLSLAVADLMVSLVVMPLGFVNDYLGHWILGQVMCNTWIAIDVLTCTASILHMCAVSIERYIAISHPLFYRKHRHSCCDNVTAKIAAVWLISAALSSFLLVSGEIWPASLHTDYTCQVSLKKFQLYGSMFAFFIPLAIVLLTYTLTTAKLHHKSNTPDYVHTNEVDKIKLTKRVRSVIQETSQNGEITDFEPQQLLIELSTKTNAKRTSSSPNGSNYQKIGHHNSYRTESIAESHYNKLYRGRRGSDGSLPIYEQRNHRRQGSVQKHILKRQTNSTRSQSTPINQPASSIQRLNPSFRSDSTRSNQSVSSIKSTNLTKENQVSILLGLVFVSFVVGWTPFFLLNIISATCPNCVPDPNVIMVFEWLAWASSIFNPFIYATFNRTYRRTFWKLVRGYCCWGQKRQAKWNSQNRGRRSRVYIHYKVQFDANTRV